MLFSGPNEAPVGRATRLVHPRPGARRQANGLELGQRTAANHTAENGGTP